MLPLTGTSIGDGQARNVAIAPGDHALHTHLTAVTCNNLADSADRSKGLTGLVRVASARSKTDPQEPHTIWIY